MAKSRCGQKWVSVCHCVSQSYVFMPKVLFNSFVVQIFATRYEVVSKHAEEDGVLFGEVVDPSSLEWFLYF